MQDKQKKVRVKEHEHKKNNHHNKKKRTIYLNKSSKN